MPANPSDKPTYEEYTDWYYREFGVDLEDGSAERWYDGVTVDGIRELAGSEFWITLPESLHAWNISFKADHEDYSIFDGTLQPNKIENKSFKSALNKSFRWNVLNNDNWPHPPERTPSTAPKSEKPDPEDKQWWFGPHNWLHDFSDIFRTRLITTYFDGIGYLAKKIEELADVITGKPPKLEFLASHHGYHAAHLGIYHQLDILDYENSDPDSVQVQLEIQLTTAIQATISKMLHRVYEDWRLNDAPPGWEWDYRDPAFSVNYLGSTLHYLEGMIVTARVQMENS